MHINDKNIYYYDSMSNNGENHSGSLMRCLKDKWITNLGTKNQIGTIGTLLVTPAMFLFNPTVSSKVIKFYKHDFVIQLLT